MHRENERKLVVSGFEKKRKKRVHVEDNEKKITSEGEGRGTIYASSKPVVGPGDGRIADYLAFQIHFAKRVPLPL